MGDLPPQESVRDWVWGHVAAEGIAIVFFEILGQDGTSFSYAEHRWADSRAASVTVERTYLGELHRTGQIADVGGVHETRLVADGAMTSLHLSLNPAGLLHSFERGRQDGFTASYGRWLTDGVARRGADIISIRGITEYLRFRS